MYTTDGLGLVKVQGKNEIIAGTKRKRHTWDIGTRELHSGVKAIMGLTRLSTASKPEHRG